MSSAMRRKCAASWCALTYMEFLLSQNSTQSEDDMIVASLVAPQPQQGALFAEHRVGIGQRHLGNRQQRFGVFGLAAAAEVETAGFGVSADHHQTATVRQALVSGAGR